MSILCDMNVTNMYVRYQIHIDRRGEGLCKMYKCLQFFGLYATLHNVKNQYFNYLNTKIFYFCIIIIINHINYVFIIHKYNII